MSEKQIVQGQSALSQDSTPPRNPLLANLLPAAADPALTEDLALALLNRPDLPREIIEQLAGNASIVKGRKLKIALVSHPSTPRHVSVPLARQLYAFDLMRVALSPNVLADVKVAVEDLLIARLKTMTLGERLTLARRASGRVAAALLLGADAHRGSALSAENKNERRVMLAALENPRLTEALVIGALLRPAASEVLVRAVANHAKWSPRIEVRAALLRTEHLSLDHALEFSHEISPPLLRELLGSSKLLAKIKSLLLSEARRAV